MTDEERRVLMVMFGLLLHFSGVEDTLIIAYKQRALREAGVPTDVWLSWGVPV